MKVNRVLLKISNRKNFGIFCEILSRNRVDFSHSGFYSIRMSEDTLKNLPNRAREFFEKLLSRKFVKVTNSVSDGSRVPLPTREQAEYLMTKFIKKKRRRG